MDIGMFCSAEETVNDRALYLWNSEFPGVIAGGSGAECGCSIEVDNCEADINVFSIQRNLTKEREWTACIPEQTLTITGSDTGQSLVWTCHDNTLFTMSNIVTSTYLTVTLNNTRTGNGGNFWLAFQASKSANITLRCPSQRQQFCLDTTTTTAISTPTVNTTTSISPTPTVNTTTSTSPTPTVNTTTPTSPTPTANTTTSTSPTPTVNTTTSTSPKPTVKTTTSTSPTPTVNTTTSTSPKPTVNTTTSTSPTLTVNTTTSTSPTPTVNSTTSTSPKPTVNTTTSTSPTPDPPKKLNLWVLIGGSTCGVIFLIIVIAVIAKCRRPQTKRDNNGTQELVTPYATVYAPHDQRLDNIPRHVDHRMSTSTYISPIHDHGYASIRGIDAPRLNEPVQNRNQPKQRMQACRGFAHIRNETF